MNGEKTYTESITGKFNQDSTVSLHVVRDDGVEMMLDNAEVGGAVTLATSKPVVPWILEMKVTAPVFTDTYRNHGDYVSRNGGGSENAHSLSGKPLNSESGK